MRIFKLIKLITVAGVMILALGGGLALAGIQERSPAIGGAGSAEAPPIVQSGSNRSPTGPAAALPTGAAASPTGTAAADTLPFTGADAWPLLAAGALMLGTGAALRRLAAAR